VRQAMFKMSKLDIATLEQAYKNEEFEARQQTRTINRKAII
jgi:hypothetical protein